MIEVDQLPNRPLTEAELEEFAAAQEVECPLAFHSFCTHCDTEGIVDALVRDGRAVYALHHGWEAWELNVLEEDMSSERFQAIVERMEQNRELLPEIAASGQRQEPMTGIEPRLDREAEPAGEDTARPPDGGDGTGDLSEVVDQELLDVLDEETRQQLQAEVDAVLQPRLDALSDEERARLFEEESEPSEEDLAALVDEDMMAELEAAIDRVFDAETVRRLEEELGVELRDDDEMMVDVETEDRFLHLYAQLLFSVNERFDVLPDVETVEELERRDLAELFPLREKLYEADTEAVIESFVAENPTGLSEADLDRIAGWTDYEYGEYVVVRHLEEYAVFLDWSDPPRAFGVRAVRMPFTDLWTEARLPVMVSKAVLLPFEGQIVTDGWFVIQQIVFGGNISTDVDDAYEEAKHRFGIIESLPPPGEPEKSDAERLRFYMKNKRNRERYAEEIQQLKAKTEDLERIYHQELGKARARSLGRELRDTDLQEAYFAIYDDRIVASGTSEEQVREVLAGIMPDGKENHPYIYHYDP